MDLLNNKDIKLRLSERTTNSNLRDEFYFKALNKLEQTSLENGARSFLQWVENNKWISDAKEVYLDRLPDSSGVSGDPTDLRLSIKGKSNVVELKNISIKHNHNALKHQRLPRLPDQCGVINANLKKEFNNNMKNVWTEFLKKSNKINPKFTKFNELKKVKIDFIDNNLYYPLIRLVIDFLDKHANNSQNASTFFSFLTGNFNFYTIKDEKEFILIKHFIDIPSPKRFKIKYPYRSINTFLLKFDNGWELTFRLHTASSAFIKNNKLNASTKFDVLCINLDNVIKIDKIIKN